MKNHFFSLVINNNNLLEHMRRKRKNCITIGKVIINENHEKNMETFGNKTELRMKGMDVIFEWFCDMVLW